MSQVVRLPLSRNVGQPDPEADLRLVRGLRDREPWAAAALVDRYLNLVRRVLVRIMGFGDAEHDDLVQEVFTRALQGAHRLTNAGALRAWLTNVAVFTGRETIRRRTRGRWLWFAGDVPDVPAIAADGDVAEAARTVYAILARLPVDERIPFALRAFEGMDLQELAEACGVSIPTVRRRLARAEKRFHSLAAQSESLSPWVQSR